MKGKKLLYIMGIDWQWIFQRPQILAKYLSADYDITVVFPRSILKKRSPVSACPPFRILWTLPYQEKNAFIGKISARLNQNVFKDIYSYDYVYINYPLYGRYIPEDYGGKVIYDCMDNHESLYPDQKRVYKILVQEQRLVKRSNLLLVSAQALAEKMNKIAGCEKSILLRNGTVPNRVYPLKKPEKRQLYSIAYIGTIASWFDYPSILESLKHCPQVEYHLIGPANEKADCPGIIYEGSVSHEHLGSLAEKYDCLVMPFVVNDIVRFVDPVKLYEYIAFGKCIVSIYYPEIERFRDFVFFYRTPEEYRKLLDKLTENGFPPKYTDVQREIFLKENTWNMRYNILKKELETLEETFTQ